MRIDKMATVIVATLCGLLLASPASARGPYPPAPPNLTVTPAVIQVGGLVTVTGSNFGPNDIVRIVVSYLNLPGTTEGAVAQGLERGGHWGGGHGGGCKGSDKGSNDGTTVLADANGGFTATLRLNRAGVAIINAIGWPSLIRASARVLVLCDDDGGNQASGDQPAASGSTVPVRSTAPSWIWTAAVVFRGLVLR